MADGTSLNPGVAGDTVRDIDRSLNVIPFAAKTQVVQQDAGGQAGESLVSPFNPMPAKLSGAAADSLGSSADTPLFVVLTGDPNGDWKGLNLLEQAADDYTNVSLGVSIVSTIQPVGAAQGNTGQVPVPSTNAVLLLGPRVGINGVGRAAVTFLNTGAVTVYFGFTPNVTVLTGFPITAGAAPTLNVQSAIYMISSAGTVTVAFFETF